MKVKFYGTRGSVPTPDPEYFYFGGNTSCVQVTFSTNRVLVLDAGTGIRNLGNDLLRDGHEQYDMLNILLSHTHWDHIQGFPYFEPAYDSRRNITISICGKQRMGNDLESLFATQMQNDFFPVALEKMGANFTFLQPDITTYVHPRGVRLTAVKYSHRGDAYGYRIEEGGKTLVYCTDVEHKNGIDPNVVELSMNADLLIHDAQYTPEELKKKKGWGHSSCIQAIEVANLAGVKNLALFHHDPEHNDTFLLKMERECRKLFPNVFVARERCEFEL